ncbi:MAG TPA: porin family protein [Bacteroidales bacterium]|nr:porin family protein [Bacteroidales bacterium]
MKKLVLILFGVIISTGAFAQFSWGLKAGATSNNFKLEDPVNVTGQQTITAAQDAAWGFHGGAFIRISALGLMIQPEVLFSMAENNMTITDAANPDGIVKSQKFNKLDVPIMLGAKLGPIRIMAGPAASVMISSASDLIEDAENLYKSATFGYQAGVGVDLFKKLTLDLRYEGGLSNFGDEITVGGETFTFDGRSNAIVVSAGIMF